jgi:hypothetical protein
MEFSFELGKPFRPFEQLMGVLPSANKDLIPLAYQVTFASPTPVITLTKGVSGPDEQSSLVDPGLLSHRV